MPTRGASEDDFLGAPAGSSHQAGTDATTLGYQEGTPRQKKRVPLQKRGTSVEHSRKHPRIRDSRTNSLLHDNMTSAHNSRNADGEGHPEGSSCQDAQTNPHSAGTRHP